MKNFGAFFPGLFLALIACHNPPVSLPDKLVSESDEHFHRSGAWALIRIDTQFFPKEERAYWHWWFNGQSVNPEQLRHEVPVRDGFDTVLAVNRRTRRDTLQLICDLRTDSIYTISYNDCCSDFYLSSHTKEGARSGQQVHFQLKGVKPGQQWLGCIGNTAIRIEPDSTNLLTHDLTHSPMQSNRYNLWVTPYAPADLDTTLYTLIDSRDGSELGGFTPQDDYRIAGINFTFLHADRVCLIYDVKKRAYTLERIMPSGK